MTELHELLGLASLAVSLVVVAGAGWSATAGWRTGGRSDHRSAVDRAVLALLAVLASAALLGALLLIGGSRPVDALHLVYGPAALVTMPLAIWIGRTSSGTGSRLRRDVWMLGGGLVTLGIAMRLLATG